MNKLTVFVIAIIMLFAGCDRPAVKAQRTVIRQVSVVDVEAGILQPPQDLIMEDSIILFSTSHYVDSPQYQTTFIDGSGKFLMPGLWDMHFHLCWREGNDSLLLPALYRNGITGIRDMGGSLRIMQTFRNRNPDGLHIYGGGPMIDGNPPVQPDFSLPIDSTSDIPKLLDSLKQAGADFFKTYSLLPEAQLKEIAAYCEKNQMRFAGHLSEYAEPETAIRLGQQSVEHLNRLDEIWQQDPERLKKLGTQMVQQKTYLCPTLITYQLKTRLRDSTVHHAAYDSFISESLRMEWNQLWTNRIKTATKNADWDRLQNVYKGQLKLVAYLDSLGVPLLAGSDFGGMPYVYPGVGLQEELALLAAAGIPTARVLQAATINPAALMNQQDAFGSVKAGKYADLLLLEKNPLEDIRNLQSVHAVWVQGRKVY